MYKRGDLVTVRFPDGREIEGHMDGWEAAQLAYPEAILVKDLAWPELNQLRQLRVEAQEADERLTAESTRVKELSRQ